MSQAYRVFVSKDNDSILEFETECEVEPLTEMDTPSLNVALNSESEAIAASVGISFDPNVFVQKCITNKKVSTNARAILTYLNDNVDSTVLRFTQDGRIFYQGKAIPGANLKKVLESLSSKASKTLEIGEYFLIVNLDRAPETVKASINRTKLQLCNIQSVTKPAKRIVNGPSKIYLPPGTSISKHNVEIKTARPVNIAQTRPATSVVTVKRGPALDRSYKPATTLQRRFNVPNKPWYKLS